MAGALVHTHEHAVEACSLWVTLVEVLPSIDKGQALAYDKKIIKTAEIYEYRTPEHHDQESYVYPSI